MKKALIVWGGWDGHFPKEVSGIFKNTLESDGFSVEVSDTLVSFEDKEKLMGLDLIVPIWTMGEISDVQCENVIEAVKSGVGIAGCHGGMCDSFRNSVSWQFMTGAQWIAHPGNDGVPYRVNIKKTSSSPIVEGMDDFDVVSEQYYIHIDPAVNVLATTRFPIVDTGNASNGEVDVPVVFTKRFGLGKVFYNSLGHTHKIFDIPEALELMKRGFLWAAK